MLDIKKLEPYLDMIDSNVCYKCGTPDPMGKKVELTIQLTNKCNCGCTFCSNSNFPDYEFDKNKFIEIFSTLKDNYPIIKVAFTGGEPTLHPLFTEMVSYVRENLSHTRIVINTNGSNLDKLKEISSLKGIEYGISRHHYDEKINAEIFKSRAPCSNEQLAEFTKFLDTTDESNYILMHCNLIKGKIDNIEEVKTYLDWSKDIGIRQVGFVELMPYTQAAKDDKAEVDFLQLPNDYFLLTRFAERKEICKCINFDYKGIKVYNRRMCTSNCRNVPNAPLVYNYNRLSKGFGGDIIWE